MRFRTRGGHILQRIARRTYPRALWTDRDLTFRDYLGWRVADSGEKLDGEFLPEMPLEAASRRIESVLAILDDWEDWTADMGGDEDEDGREDLAKIRRMKCHLRRTLKGPELR